VGQSSSTKIPSKHKDILPSGTTGPEAPASHSRVVHHLREHFAVSSTGLLTDLHRQQGQWQVSIVKAQYGSVNSVIRLDPAFLALWRFFGRTDPTFLGLWRFFGDTTVVPFAVYPRFLLILSSL